ncbi:serine/threonine-protein kinase/endoribonuclease ire-1 [Adelges cooleyi]|uniref:serine/threonine-protein kinase/endoribonuclease ire-1 n=1 Tax=Adelges cooleyi TaxID=133065 RepID=UPI00217FCC58|nr:serine/threonine-protein kinase/endoribonuclease ire-1 [Adelges cooleyi]
MALNLQSLILLLGLIYVHAQTPDITKDDKSLAKISVIQYEGVIFLSTLDGSFIAVDQNTGKTLWNFADDPPVKVPSNIKDALSPLFLPDPRDGSLYLLHNKDKVGIKKLDITIPQLVANSPCRSSDGILFSGKKIDSWYFIDWNTGEKYPFMNFDKDEDICTAIASKSILLSKSEYSVLMVDSTSSDKRQWNVTFFSYNSKTMTDEQIFNHGMKYFSASSSGHFVVFRNPKDKLDKPPESNNYHNLVWEREFDSPVIGVYLHDGESLLSLPLTNIAKDSIKHLITDIVLTSKDPNTINYFNTLYIGHHVDTGLYALPAIAESSEVNPLVDRGLIVLLDKTSFSVLPYYSGNDFNVEPKNVENHTILLGHYQLSQDSNTGIPRITGNTDSIIYYHNMSGYNYSNKQQTSTISTQTPQSLENGFIVQILGENAGIKVFMVWITLLMSLMFWYLKKEMKGLKNNSNNGYNSSQGSSKGSNHSVSNSSQIVEELPDGSFSIGKIMFRTDQILGKGCEGTSVFKGEFERRPVAVKRLLPECFIAGEREVHILRESDYHPNVVRYFCTEQDKHFRYIALELCAATLQDYVEKNILSTEISQKDVMLQSIKGLQHLHSLGIVHRDIKPHNVLLSVPSRGSGSFSSVRALISDFGLCKKLQGGKMSFSKRSGVTGTDGWIAPEMFNENASVTKSIDIFSMGCLFYYILSNGKHPFGDNLSRQSKIFDGQAPCLDALYDNEIWKRLIAVMISQNPEERPTASAVRSYPSFWTSCTLLSFLQDVSDRVEKEQVTSSIMLELEKGGDGVFGNDGWHDKIHEEITSELRKYRTYRSNSIRDLLRAFRNKKHHFRELSEGTQKLLGDIPDKFLEYWTVKFPLLVYHTWTAMQCLSSEITFAKYYTSCFMFPRTEFTNLPNWLYESDQPAAFSSLQQKSSRRPNTNTNSWRHKRNIKNHSKPLQNHDFNS